MFLKLTFVDESKKLVLKEEYKNPSSLRALVTKLKGYADSEFDLVFIDMENEQITIHDELDMAYFMEQTRDGRKYLELMVIPRPVEEPEFKIIEQDVEEAPVEEEEKENDYDVVLKSEIVAEKKTEEAEPVEEAEEEVVMDNKDEVPFDEQIVPALRRKLEAVDAELDDLVIEQVDLEEVEEPEKNVPELEEKVVEEVTIATDEPIEPALEPEEETTPLVAEPEPKEEATPKQEKNNNSPHHLPFHTIFNNIFKSIGEAMKEHKKKVKENRKNKLKQKKCAWFAKHKQQPHVHNEPVVHYNIYCDGCNVGPIVGKRFNCMVCPDFDFCAKCEDSNVHSHPMMRINNPMQQWKLHKLKKKLARVEGNNVHPNHTHPLHFFPFGGPRYRGHFHQRGPFNNRGKCWNSKPYWAKRKNSFNPEEERVNKLQMLNFMLGDTITQEEKEALVDKHPNMDIIRFAKKIKKAYKN